MGKRFKVNDNLFYAENEYVKNNVFIDKENDGGALPKFKNIKKELPVPVWDARPDAVSCYYKTWQTGFKNLRKANKRAGFVSDFIDTAFNGYLFMWDSSFIVMFGKYASRIFDFQKTLDNFYSHQHRDGFICREICETAPGEQFTRDDPASTGPNVLPWAEWEYFLSTGDRDRLSKVFDPLMAYHKWLRLNRSWQDGSYFSCGLACGMDNQPRQEKGYDEGTSHGFMSWIDTCAQQYLSARILIEAAAVLGREDETGELKEEAELLKNTVLNKMWDAQDNYYYDTRRDGSFSKVKSIAAYWTLLADLVPEDRMEKFVAHLENKDEFNRHNAVPSLSADHPEYQQYGGYWNGGVWAPTNYMVLCGLHRHGYDELAHKIAVKFLNNVLDVYNETGTVYENYAPELSAPGKPARKDFVGWTGLAPVSVMFEYVFGIHPDAMAKKITWNVFLTDRHGVENYPLGDATVTLICEKRNSPSEEPVITVKSDREITVEVICSGKTVTVHSNGGSL